MIKITNYNVGQADCILFHFESKEEIKDKEGKSEVICKNFNLLIDGGYAKDNVVGQLKESLKEEKLHGIVVTHIDSDHISGILKIINKNVLDFTNTFVLFNKYDENLISYNQGKKLATEMKKHFNEELIIKSYAKSYSIEDNAKINSIKNKKMELEVNLMSHSQRKKSTSLDKEKVNITMLGPNIDSIKKFMQNWSEEKVEAETTNKSSIMLLIEFEGKAVLMSGDGYLNDIEEVLGEIEIDKIDVIKASHHGAKENNIGLLNLIDKYKSEQVLFTIKGIDDEKHPDSKLIEQLYGKCQISCSADVSGENLKKYIETKNEIFL